MNNKPVVLSGMQPSGPLHIGNYLGALKNWVDIQNSGDYECYFFIADYHTLTSDMTPEERKHHTITLAAEYIAAGLDPQKSTIFVQSHVPAHTELAWIFNSLTPIAELERMTQFKDKKEKQSKNINVGLFTYPVLQAADILLYHATHVPVGKDQVQHVELTNDIAKWCNNRYGNYFQEVAPLLTDIPKVQSLLAPEKKMSKSFGEGHVINISDNKDDIEKKLKKAVTANQGGGDNPGAENLLTLLKHFGDNELYNQYTTAEKNGTIRYGELKQDLANSIADHFAELRQKKEKLLSQPETIYSILNTGAQKANSVANQTLSDIRQRIGVQ